MQPSQAAVKSYQNPKLENPCKASIEGEETQRPEFGRKWEFPKIGTHSTLNSWILIIRTPKYSTPNFQKPPNRVVAVLGF